MDIDRKKKLLQISDNIAVDINKNNCGNFVPTILNAIKIVKDNGEGIDKVGFYLEAMKKGQFGGDSEKVAYNNFVNSYKNNYCKEFKDLTIDELEYVFAWTRKIVNTKKNVKIDEKPHVDAKAKGSSDTGKAGKEYGKKGKSSGTKMGSTSSNKRQNGNREQTKTNSDSDDPWAKLKNYKFN